VIERVRGKDEFVFVKTSCRSAKDTTVFSESFRSLYRSFLLKKQDRSENSRIISLLEAGTEILKVRSAREVLQMFCRSERVHQDLTLALEHPNRFEQNFVVRKWADIDVSLEFRGFVCNGKLNALSQYNHLCFFSHLLEKKDEISERIQTLFNTHIRDKLATRFSRYIIDFAFDSKLETIWVIELNPFLVSTGKYLKHSPLSLILIN
jgi:hypothetical protein